MKTRFNSGSTSNQMKQTEPLESVVDVAPEVLIDSCVNKWVLEWCKKYHPEAVEEAREFVKEYLEESGDYSSVEEFKAGWSRGSSSGS